MIGRRFLDIGGRQLHIRIRGAGPAVVLLHQTPQSSRTMEPVMHRLDGFTALAIDTPGFGLSDPARGTDWSIAGLAETLRAALDALGIGRAALIGQHTGATIAAEFARRWPERTACLAADGFTAFTPDEARSILPHQLPRFAPTTDGAHLAWAWARFRDGWMFFPWSDRRLARRRALDLPDPAAIHDGQVMELLRSGESYRAVYPAVFGWDGVAAARGLACPALLAATADDQLAPHLDRLGPLPPGVALMRLPAGDRAGMQAALAGFVRRHGGSADRPAPLTDTPEPGARGYVRLADGRHIAFRRAGRGGAPAHLVLHAAGSASECELAGLTGAEGVIALDLPGHGESDPPAAGWEPAALARDVAACLEALAPGALRVRGRGLGAAVAVELARARPGRVAALRLGEIGPADPATRGAWAARYAGPVVPRWDGTHLLSLWHELRDRELFCPWFDRRHAAARRCEPGLDPGRLAARFFAELRCADRVRANAAWLGWDPRAALADLPCPVELAAVPGDGWERDRPLLLAAAGAGARAVDAAPDGDGLGPLDSAPPA